MLVSPYFLPFCYVLRRVIICDEWNCGVFVAYILSVFILKIVEVFDISSLWAGFVYVPIFNFNPFKAYINCTCCWARIITWLRSSLVNSTKDSRSSNPFKISFYANISNSMLFKNRYTSSERSNLIKCYTFLLFLFSFEQLTRLHDILFSTTTVDT